MIQSARPSVPAFCSVDNDKQPDRPPAKVFSPARALDRFLRSPLAGIAPWALLAILSGPGRFELAAAGALGLSALVMLAGLSRGVRVHALEVFGTAFFGAMLVVGLFATDNAIRWLELWSGELTNAALACFAWLTLLIRRPFTMAYAKDTTPPEHWDSPLFKKINTVITIVWAGAFTFAGTVGFIGDYLWHDGTNFWTGWILQLAAIFFAAAITDFYPDYAAAKFDLANGEPALVPSVLQTVGWLPSFLTVTGIAGLLTNSVDSLAAIALIVAGNVASSILAKVLPRQTKS
ncbi:hypothetical protein [Mycobacterium marinum]|uniref:hypothetical protein n=1 Tax=Mycobacterium marinum TaxID=1781 RepID=UPI003563A669